MIEDEQFFAWLDGELSPQEAARVEAEVASDPRLARLADEHRAMAGVLSRAFAEVEAQPVPNRLESVLDRNSKIISLDDARADREKRKAPSIWVHLSALAATLAVGIFTGTMMTGMPSGGAPSLAETKSGELIAAADLDQALHDQLASAPSETGIRIGLTFREKSGAICRTFFDKATSGLACREGSDWQIRGLFQSPEGQDGDYRMASGPEPLLMESVESSIVGEPFDAARERAARDAGWR